MYPKVGEVKVELKASDLAGANVYRPVATDLLTHPSDRDIDRLDCAKGKGVSMPPSKFPCWNLKRKEGAECRMS
ncbi:hypothetical protein VTL71DRAFT_12656 [Oculimacula yallundae]|uniref:Uncharacterized protein n=1 Tax=Oculimacula yallundae TaxID=86028 RepID=A0ABR4CPX4_9HELO